MSNNKQPMVREQTQPEYVINFETGQVERNTPVEYDDARRQPRQAYTHTVDNTVNDAPRVVSYSHRSELPTAGFFTRQFRKLETWAPFRRASRFLNSRHTVVIGAGVVMFFAFMGMERFLRLRIFKVNRRGFRIDSILDLAGWLVWALSTIMSVTFGFMGLIIASLPGVIWLGMSLAGSFGWFLGKSIGDGSIVGKVRKFVRYPNKWQTLKSKVVNWWTGGHGPRLRKLR